MMARCWRFSTVGLIVGFCIVICLGAQKDGSKFLKDLDEIDNIIDDGNSENDLEIQKKINQDKIDDDDDDEHDDDENEDEDEENDNEANHEEKADTVKPLTQYHASCEKSMCDLKITPIGCYHDGQTNRPLPLLLDSHRDVTSRAFHGEVIDWRNGEKSFRKLACDCATKTRKAGYTHFGLQFYGECWSSKTAAKDYKKDGDADTCLNGKYKECKPGEFCVGQSMTNYVYRIEPITPRPCTTKFEKVGCFYDPVNTKHRPLPDLLDSNRDITSHAHHGDLLDWGNYRASLEKLVCHCAERAKKRGHTHFGIEYYGECWSGKNSSKTYNKYGSSKNCVNPAFAKCDPKSDCLCTGKGFALFVYKVK